MTAEVAPGPAATVAPPGVTRMVYPVMGLSPSLAGAVHVTVAEVLPAVAATDCGAAGAGRGRMLIDTGSEVFPKAETLSRKPSVAPSAGVTKLTFEPPGPAPTSVTWGPEV